LDLPEVYKKMLDAIPK